MVLESITKIEPEISITVSDVIEYHFCPRFIFFMYCLSIPQHEEQRFKVQKGRTIHDSKAKLDKEYLRKKLNVINKDTNVYLSSKIHHIRGIVDEVLFFNDDTAGPLDYKFAKYNDKIFQTYKNQVVLYGLMIRENYGMEVDRGYICYTRSNNLVKEVRINEKDIDNSILKIEEILKIILNNFFPKKTKSKNRCIDCCYRNICV